MFCATIALWPPLPNRIGLPCSSRIRDSSPVARSVSSLKRLAIEHAAVLEDLDNDAPRWLRCRFQHFHQVSLVGKHSPRHEGRLGGKGGLHRANGLLDRSQRTRLGYLAYIPKWANTAPW